MPISRPAGLAAAFLALAACDPAAMGGTSDRTTVAVAGRSITVAAPPGFCVDPASTNVGRTGAFVMVSDCALLGGRRADGDSAPVGAVMTASISAAQGETGGDPLREVATMTRSVQGLAVLGRSGRGDRVRVLATRNRNGVLYLLIEDRGPQPVDGVEPQFWRAFLMVQGQMTVLSVLGFEGAGLGASESLGHIQSFADSLQRANPA